MTDSSTASRARDGAADDVLVLIAIVEVEMNQA